MKNLVLQVEGMSCSHCENTIKKAVGAIAGVSNVTVSLEAKTVTVEYNGLEGMIDKIREEIEDQGYDVV